MKYATVVFDFDGTIADTQTQIFEIANLLADEFGYEKIQPSEISELKRMGARELVVERLKIPLWNLVKIYRLEKRGRALLFERAAHIQVFSGVAECIAALRLAGMRVGIVTSNAHTVVSAVLTSAKISVDFVHAGSSFFGKDKAIAHALGAQRLDPQTVVYVGDELRDFEACKKVGIAMFGVSWGYNDPSALREVEIGVVESAQQLQQKLLEM